MRRDTLIDFFDSFAALPDEFLIHYNGYRTARFTYREIAASARAYASRLDAAGLRKGDRVLFWSENRPEWIAALWGCLLRGIVVVPVDYRTSGELLARIQTVAGAKLLWAGDETAIPPDLGIPLWRFTELDRQASGESLAPVEILRDDIAEILFTSGATAEPKGVIIRHGNILANIVPVEREVLKYRPYGKLFFPLRFLNLLPLSHMFGQAMATFIPAMLPGVVVFLSGYNPHEIVQQVRSRKVSVVVCVPKILEVLREYVLSAVPEAAEAPAPGIHWLVRWWKYRRVHRLFGWKFWSFVAGAAPLDPVLEEFWTRMGYVVIQGYGLTETAPIVTLNHPFHTSKGSVGKPIAGVEVKIAEDGEILVRGENVTSGYLNADAESVHAFDDGWFHTGDIGSIDESGQMQIRGRKKEMIVTPEGLNVFPEDVERVLNALPGVRESAVVGTDRAHAVLVLESGTDANSVVRQANARLENHQQIRTVAVWPGDELPRTDGTRKLKRREILAFVSEGKRPEVTHSDEAALLTRIEQGLSSLERVELMIQLEQRFGVRVDEAAYANAKSADDLKRILAQPAAAAPEPVDFPSWNRRWWARAVRRIHLPLWILPLARVFSHVRVRGLENLEGIEPPVIFAPNHQSHLDVPSLMIALPAKWRYRVAPAMSKEFFRAHFHPEQHSRLEWFTNSLNYYLSSLCFNAFPLPQREAGARQTIRYAGDLVSEGWCIVIFPEGRITDTGEIGPFQPGVGLLASRLHVPVVPVRLVGLDKVLHRTWRMARPGRVEAHFGRPLRLEGDDYATLARQVEAAVRELEG